VTLIVAVPSFRAVTIPFFTATIFDEDVDQVKVVWAVAGYIVGFNVKLSFMFILILLDTFKDIEVGFGASLMVSVAVAFNLLIVAVMLTVPAFKADTKPEELTVAILLLLLDHFTFLFVVFSGMIIAVS